jgi:ABC-2 type transport system ATP-binding protein
VPGIWSVAQLGARLHALIDPNAPDPAGAVRATLSRAGVAARVEVAQASLEDVFVAATTDRGAPS